MVHAQATATTPRALRREKTSERILDTAEAILGSEGSAALTMQRLASELGYTVGATYRYYESKEAIVAALQRRVFASLADDMATRIDTSESELVRVAVVARIYATLALRRPLHARLLARMLGEPESLVDATHGARNTQVALQIGGAALRELAAARVAGALATGNDVERGLVLWAALSGVAQTRKLERWQVPGLDTDVLTDHLVRTLLIGWGADAKTTDDAIARAKTLVPSHAEPQEKKR